MSLLEHPDAQALLADAVVTPDEVRGCQDRITAFLQRYLPRFYRAEQRTHATLGPSPRHNKKDLGSRSPSRPASTASLSRTSSAQAGGTTSPSWPNSAA